MPGHGRNVTSIWRGSRYFFAADRESLQTELASCHRMEHNGVVSPSFSTGGRKGRAFRIGAVAKRLGRKRVGVLPHAQCEFAPGGCSIGCRESKIWGVGCAEFWRATFAGSRG